MIKLLPYRVIYSLIPSALSRPFSERTYDYKYYLTVKRNYKDKHFKITCNYDDTKSRGQYGGKDMIIRRENG